MSSSVLRDDKQFCAQCGNNSVSTLYEDYMGAQSETSTCCRCGYHVVVDAGGGGWDDATWVANQKEGVIVMAQELDNAPDFDIRFVPGSLVGANATKAACDARGLDVAWVAFVTNTSVTMTFGEYPFPDFDMNSCVASARKLLSAILVQEALAA